MSSQKLNNSTRSRSQRGRGGIRIRRRVVYQKGLNPRFGSIDLTGGGYRWQTPAGDWGVAETYAEARLMILEPHLRRICGAAVRAWGVGKDEEDVAIQTGIVAVWEALAEARDPTPRGLNDAYLIYRARRWASAYVSRHVTRYANIELAESELSAPAFGDPAFTSASVLDVFSEQMGLFTPGPEQLVPGRENVQAILDTVTRHAKDPEVYRTILALLASGHSAPAVGERLGVTKQAIQSRMRCLKGWLQADGLTRDVLLGNAAD